jgi:predicted secreted protein
MPSVSGAPLEDATAVTAAPGTEIELQLAAAPTTGYVWEPRIVPTGLLIVGRSHTPADANAIGGAGTDTFRVRVTAAGAYDLVFVLSRPWEAQAVRTHTFHITAGP